MVKAHFSGSCRDIFRKLGLLTVPGLIVKEACLLVKENVDCLNSAEKERIYNTRNKNKT